MSAITPRIVAHTGPCDVIAAINAKPFLAKYIPIQLHASVPPAQRAVASASTGAADNSRAVA